MDIIGAIVDFILDLISSWGYPGIFFLMALESACMPIPSEVVMPFAGYLAYQGEMDFWTIVVVGSLGCTFGSIIAYVAGYYAGRPLILKYGKYFLITEKHLVQAEEWFKKWGPKATFIARLLPVIRTVISLPAGVAKMDFKKFALYSFVGSVPWNFMLAYAGYVLGAEWESIETYYREFEILLAVVGVCAVVFYFWHLRKSKDEVLTKEVSKDTADQAGQDATKGGSEKSGQP
ncbi:MAG: DedA family protein [Thermoplasmata archaeon]|jgi:membrane protein DedA with SNARE-associated domain|nr:DedA family protein [Thermoplasmata archaeon]